MMDAALPLLKGYDWVQATINATVGPGGQQPQLYFKEDFQGYVQSMFAAFSGDPAAKDVTVTIRLDYPQRTLSFSITPSKALYFGFTSPNAAQPYVTRFDTTNNVYALGFSPAAWIPFNYRFEIFVVPPPTATNPITVLGGYTIFRVVDPEAYVESLRSIYAAQVVQAGAPVVELEAAPKPKKIPVQVPPF